MLSGSGLVDGGAPPHQGGGAEAGGGAAVAAESMNRNDNSVVFGDDENGRIMEEGERNSAGNRWPRQETLALLKIRSDMDVAFRDSSVKGPLWDEVSRKLAELGFHRSAKKCKEKFENVYKYHKRTKDGRSTKSDGKTYRFFDQLEALDQNHPSFSLMSAPPPPPKAQPSSAVPTMAMPVSSNPPIVMSHFNDFTTVSSSLNPTHSDARSPNVFTITPSSSNPTLLTTNAHGNNPHVLASSLPNIRHTMSSSSTSSDEELHGRQTNRKRKWKDFFEGLMKEVIERQEQLQKKFLEAMEKREHDRMAREEAWRMQEMERLNREHEILVQERSMAAVKDTAVIAFLQKLSEQNQFPGQLLFQPQDISSAKQARPTQVQLERTQAHAVHVQIQRQGPQRQQLLPPLTALTPKPPPVPQPSPALTKAVDVVKPDNGNHSSTSSRWPKAEVEALINLRTNLDLKYQDSGPKGPLWEEISSGMKRLGYNRNSKRCKEKWENINKYFKKVKESNKQRPEDSKTCPYYHLLDALYKERNKSGDGGDIFPGYGLSNKSDDGHSNNPSANLAPLMVQPEQQWPPPPPLLGNNVERQNAYGNKEEEDEEDDLEDEDEGGDEEDDNGTMYEIVPNKQQAAAGSMSATE